MYCINRTREAIICYYVSSTILSIHRTKMKRLQRLIEADRSESVHGGVDLNWYQNRAV